MQERSGVFGSGAATAIARGGFVNVVSRDSITIPRNAGTMRRRRFTGWLTSWFRTAGVIRTIDRLDRSLVAAEINADRMDKRLAKRIGQLNKEREALAKRVAADERRLRTIGETLAEDLEDAKMVQRRYEEELEAVRQENRILNDVIIPTLVAQHKVVLERLDADVAVEVRRRTAAS